MRLDLAPILWTGAVDRSLDNPVVFRASRIGEDDELVAMMLDGIVVLRLALGDEPSFCPRILGIDDTDLGRLVVVYAEQNETPALGCVDTQEKTRLLLIADERVLRLRTHI